MVDRKTYLSTFFFIEFTIDLIYVVIFHINVIKTVRLVVPQNTQVYSA